MKVILLENVKRIGSIGEVIEVKRGYARNFLIANKKALYASKENISEVEKLKQIYQKKIMKRKKKLSKFQSKLMVKNMGLKN
jgi:large subunit ribosomal protein L9